MTASTRRGEATRSRIVEAAVDLMFARGVRVTTLDDVQNASGTSRSQLFHYFPGGKADIVRAVAARQAARVLDGQGALLAGDDWSALQAWRDGVVETQRHRHCAGGCPLGSLASELAEHDEPTRSALAGSFREWQTLIARVLAAMQRRGVLRSDADVDALALATLAAAQGGLLLAQTMRSVEPLEVALDAALDHLHAQEC